MCQGNDRMMAAPSNKRMYRLCLWWGRVGVVLEPQGRLRGRKGDAALEECSGGQTTGHITGERADLMNLKSNETPYGLVLSFFSTVFAMLHYKSS